jgi:pyridoxine 4-dehydrogenase
MALVLLPDVARSHGVGVGVGLARSHCMLPIPGTSRVAHLEDNMRAVQIKLTDEELSAIEAATG